MRRDIITPRRRRERDREDVNPLSSVANLFDVMLIFACGLMVAIVALWKVDLDMSKTTAPSQGNYYQDMGRAYVDPETGQIYIIQEGE